MATPKTRQSSQGVPMHYSVGGVIVRNKKYLLIDRTKIPLGFAGLAGHVDEGEDFETALHREVLEESDLEILSTKLLFDEELDWNSCSRGITVHHWQLFQCEVKDGDLQLDKAESKSIDWYSLEDIRKLKLEPVWQYWFEKLGLFN